MYRKSYNSFSVFGAPISSLILLSDGVLGLRGWQWLFIIEGLPACVLGFAVLALLPDGPASAPWLNDRERATVSARLAEDRARHGRVHTAFGPAMVDGRVWLLCLTYFGIVVGLYGVGLWLPQLIRWPGFSIAQVGVLTALPYLASAAAMMAWGRRSDRKGERVRHVALPTLLAAAGLVAAIALPRAGGNSPRSALRPSASMRRSGRSGDCRRSSSPARPPPAASR